MNKNGHKRVNLLALVKVRTVRLTIQGSKQLVGGKKK